ncbi:MAG: hypothetical protein AAFX06_19935, partial [Planctomycetota bacterium]
FYIGQSPDGSFHPIYNDEHLGRYAHLWQAAASLATNTTFSVLHKETFDLLDTSTLGIPEDPSEWERIH